MQRARCAHALHQPGQVQRIAHTGLQAMQGRFNRLLQARSRFARGRSQRHPQLGGIRRRGKQQRQQARGGIGFAGTGAAGDDREMPPQRQRASHFLPIAVFGARRGKERIQPLARSRCIQRHRACLAALQDVAGYGAFMVPVAAQIQQGLRTVAGGQYQGLTVVGVPAHHPHQGAGLQRHQPVVAVHGQLRPQCLQRRLLLRLPAQHGVGGVHQLRQWQATVAPPLHLRQHSDCHQGTRRCLCILLQHPGSQCHIQAAQHARIGPVAQHVQGQRWCQRLMRHSFGKHIQRGGIACAFATHALTSSNKASRACNSASTGGTWCTACAGPSSPRKK